MDPYVESLGLWEDFRAGFLVYGSEALADALPESYLVQIDEWFLSEKTSVTLPLEPVELPPPFVNLDEPNLRYLKITYDGLESFVTVLVLLSRTNKREPGRTDYCASARLSGVRVSILSKWTYC